MYMINQYNEVNIMGLSNIFQAISLKRKKHTVQKIILSSSRSVYGEGKYECPNCGIIYPRSRRAENMAHGDFTIYCELCNEPLKLLPYHRRQSYQTELPVCFYQIGTGVDDPDHVPRHGH